MNYFSHPYNLAQQIVNMKELDIPSNLRKNILKLPYKLRERWRTVACDLQEQRGRVVFTADVTFLEKQVKIVSHPLFGNIQDSQPASHNKSPKTDYANEGRERSTFANSITAVNEGDRSYYDNETKSSSDQSNIKCCLFCQRTSHSMEKCSLFKLKVHQYKICFIKEKGICFGCRPHK